MHISTTHNYLEDWDYDRAQNDRLLRLHTSLLDSLTPCGHGLGLNRPFPQGGCAYCFSRVVVTNCTVLAARLSARKEAA